MNKATYIKLASNPHYKMSKKQRAELESSNINLHTQQIEPSELNLIRFKGKKDDAKSDRDTLSEQENDKKDK